MKKFKLSTLSLVGLSALLASQVSLADMSKITEQLTSMGLTDSQYEISDSPISDLKKVYLKDAHESFYITKDASTALMGKLYEIKNHKFIDPAFKKLETFKDEMIVYKAPEEKYVVTAFVDITCHYCHLLHEQMKGYNDLGITFRFLAYPREGLEGKVATQMESIFTAEDRNKAYDDAENGKLPKVLKEPNIVKKHYQYGMEFGISGTPALITPEGQVIPGYLKPQELLKALEDEAKNKKQ